METTLVILKPSAVLHGYVGQIVQRFQQKGLVIRGMKMMQLGEPILREHYAHLTDRPFFPRSAQIHDGVTRDRDGIVGKRCGQRGQNDDRSNQRTQGPAGYNTRRLQRQRPGKHRSRIRLRRQCRD